MVLLLEATSLLLRPRESVALRFVRPVDLCVVALRLLLVALDLCVELFVLLLPFVIDLLEFLSLRVTALLEFLELLAIALRLFLLLRWRAASSDLVMFRPLRLT